MSSTLRARIFSVMTTAAGLATLGCTSRQASNAPDDRVELRVYAASSLTEVFRDLEARFEAKHPHVDVRIELAGSQVLRLQIEEGAPADVFASANPEHVQALLEADLVEGAETFAANDLVVVVPLGNPAGIRSLADLSKAERLVVGTESVPVGRYTLRLLERASTAYGAEFGDAVMKRIVSRESNVRLVRAKVELAEADAAVVYRTDAAGSDALQVVEIPPALNVQAEYRVAVVSRSSHTDWARRWVDLVLSDPGRQALRQRGFSVDDS